MAHRLGRAPPAISRELRRNGTGSRGYRPFEAHRRATARRARSHRRRIEVNGELRQLVAELLAQRWSPQQISRHLRVKFPGQPGQPGMCLCHESIYQAVYQPGSVLLRPSRLAPHHRSPLARHRTITRSLGAPVYFCDSHSPWQRGSNENTNGLLRDYFPKGTDLSTHSPQHLPAVENELSNRPRLVLHDRAPAELFGALLASNNPSVLRR